MRATELYRSPMYSCRYEDLIAKLAENGKIASEDYSGSLTECLEFLPDLALDAPSASNRFGVAVGAGLAHHLCTHDVFESDFFEELDLRSSQVVFIEVCRGLALHPLDCAQHHPGFTGSGDAREIPTNQPERRRNVWNSNRNRSGNRAGQIQGRGEPIAHCTWSLAKRNS